MRLGVLLLLCLISRTAAAEMIGADSLEWQTVDADVVVRGTVTAVTATRGPGDVIWYDATVRVTEAIKGKPGATIRLGVRHLFGATPSDWLARRTDLLLFLVEGKDRAAEDKHYARQAFALRPHSPAVELGATRIQTTALASLRSPDDVLRAARHAARSAATRSHVIDVPMGTPAHGALYGGSSVSLVVPIDAALESTATTWVASTDGLTRQQGARALALFRSSANIARLEKLLSDPYFITGYHPNGKPPERRYVVRAVAHATLAAWGVPHATPILEEPETN